MSFRLYPIAYMRLIGKVNVYRDLISVEVIA